MSSKSSNTFLVLLAGLGIGLIAGTLLAPDKGSETRAKLKKLADDFTDFLKNSVNSNAKDATTPNQDSTNMS